MVLNAYEAAKGIFDDEEDEEEAGELPIFTDDGRPVVAIVRYENKIVIHVGDREG